MDFERYSPNDFPMDNQKNGGKAMISESFYKAFDRVDQSKTPEKIICIILAVVFAFLLAVSGYEAIDKTPATFDDYVPLNARLVAVQEEPTKLLEGDGTIIIENGVVKYTVKNDECEMTGTYDTDYKLIQKAQKDASTSFIVANLEALFIFIIISVITSFALFVLIFLVLFFANIIICVVKKFKEKRALKKAEEKPSEEDNNFGEECQEEVVSPGVEEEPTEESGDDTSEGSAEDEKPSETETDEEKT